MKNAQLEFWRRHSIEEIFSPEELTLFRTLSEEEGGSEWTQEKQDQLDEMNRRILDFEDSGEDESRDETEIRDYVESIANELSGGRL